MKRVGLVLSLVCVLLISGCSKMNEYENLMKKYATDYYNNYQRSINIDQTDEYYAQVTIEMLNNANEDNKYKMSKLDKCSKESSVSMKINLNTKDIENYEFDLKCD